MAKHALIVYNPVSSTTTDPDLWLGKVARELVEQADYIVTVYFTVNGRSYQDLIPLIKPPVDIVIAAGGDGTARFVISALAEIGSDIPCALLPLGTLNVLARNLGVVEERFFASPPKHAVQTILEGTPLRIDLGKMNNEYFAVAAGLGPMSDAFLIPSREEKRHFKIASYAGRMLESIATPPPVFKITTEDGSFITPATGIFVTNVEDFGLGKPSDVGELTDGLLSLNVVVPREFTDYVKVGLRYAFGYTAKGTPVYSRKVKEAYIESLPTLSSMSGFQSVCHNLKQLLVGRPFEERQSRTNLDAMADGEQHGASPIHIKVIPQAVNVIMSPAKAALLTKSAQNQLPVSKALK